MSKTIIAIVGTYRRGRVIETAVDAVLDGAASAGARTEKIMLLDRRIEFCTNCRSCTQQPGETRGSCPIEDDMAGLLEVLEKADAIVLASPINFGSVTALMQRFVERLTGCAYWPWGAKKGPQMRFGKPRKPAIVITSSACPAILGRFLMPFSRTLLKEAARCLGFRVVRTLYFGMVAVGPEDTLSAVKRRRARAAGYDLAQR